MTAGNAIAILISIAALYGSYAFIQTKLRHRVTFPWRKMPDGSVRIF